MIFDFQQAKIAECFHIYHPHTNDDHDHKLSAILHKCRKECANSVYGFSNLPNIRDCRVGWPVWPVIGLSGSIMYFNVEAEF